MYVNLLSYTSGTKKVLAVIRAEGGELQVEGTLAPRIMETLDGEFQNFEGDGDAFLKHLPMVFSGTYTRAELVKE